MCVVITEYDGSSKHVASLEKNMVGQEVKKGEQVVGK